MTPAEWTTVIIGCSGAVGALLGYAFAVGVRKARYDNQGEILKEVVESLAKCQARGTECSASMRILVETNTRRISEVQNELTRHKDEVSKHHERVDVHTTAEWRMSVLSRLDRIETNVAEKLDDQTKTLLLRIEAVERTVRSNGGAK